MVRDTELSSSPSFEHQASEVMGRLRATFAELIASVDVPGGIRRAADLQRELSIGRTPAWQIYKIAGATDIVAAGAIVPGPAPMNRLLSAATKKGVPKAVIESASKAYAEFESLVQQHAGDRRSFNAMVNGKATESAGEIDVHHRRTAFRANSHIWGVQARTRLSCYMFHPGTKEDLADLVCIRGLIDLRWLRRSPSPFVLSRTSKTESRENLNVRPKNEQYVREPLDPIAHEDHGVALLRQYCSKPLPPIRTSITRDGAVKTEILNSEIGNASTITCIVGDVTRNCATLWEDEFNDKINAQASIRIPCEVIVSDLLIYDNMYGPIDIIGSTLSEHDGSERVAGGEEPDTLPVEATVVHLGRGPDVMHSADVPNYSSMAHYAIDHLGWDSSKFDVYRCRIEYPIMPSRIRLSFPLRTKPQDH